MSAPEIRVDYEKLAHIATRFGKSAAQTQSLHQRLKQQSERLVATSWQGAGADAFTREMQSVVFPALLRLIHGLQTGERTAKAIGSLMLKAEREAAALFQSEAAPPIAEGVASGGSIGDNGITSGGSFGENGASDTISSGGSFGAPSDAWYQAHGYEQVNGSWVYTGNYVITDVEIAQQVLAEAGIQLQGSAWSEQDIINAAQGVADLVEKIGEGYGHLQLLTGGNVVFSKPHPWEDASVIPLIALGATKGTPAYAPPPPLSDGNIVYFDPYSKFDVSKYVVVHETAHLIDWDSPASEELPDGPPLTVYSEDGNLPGTNWETWGETLTYWVYGAEYGNYNTLLPGAALTPEQEEFIESIIYPNGKAGDNEGKVPGLEVPK